MGLLPSLLDASIGRESRVVIPEKNLDISLLRSVRDNRKRQFTGSVVLVLTSKSIHTVF